MWKNLQVCNWKYEQPGITSREEVWQRFREETAQCKTRLAQQQEKKEEAKRKQPSLSSVFERTTAYSNENPKVQRLNGLLVQLICKEGLPFNILESPAFQAFVHELDPRYKLPTRKCCHHNSSPMHTNPGRTKYKKNLSQQSAWPLLWTCGRQPSISATWMLLVISLMTSLTFTTDVWLLNLHLAVTQLSTLRLH